MKAYDVVGLVCEGAIYHPECAPKSVDGKVYDASPVFASEVQPGEYCEFCLGNWIRQMHEARAKGIVSGKVDAPSYIYLDGTIPDAGNEPDESESEQDEGDSEHPF